MDKSCLSKCPYLFIERLPLSDLNLLPKIFTCHLLCFVLLGAKAVGDVDVGRNKYAMNIIMPSSEETDEFRLTFESVRPSFTLSNG